MNPERATTIKPLSAISTCWTHKTTFLTKGITRKWLTTWACTTNNSYSKCSRWHQSLRRPFSNRGVNKNSVVKRGFSNLVVGKSKISNKPCSSTCRNRPTTLLQWIPIGWGLLQLRTTFKFTIACKPYRKLTVDLRIMIHWTMEVTEANNNNISSSSSSKDIIKRSRMLNQPIRWWINLDQVPTWTSINQITITRSYNRIIILCYNRSSKYNQPTFDSKIIRFLSLRGLLTSCKVTIMWILAV